MSLGDIARYGRRVFTTHTVVHPYYSRYMSCDLIIVYSSNSTFHNSRQSRDAFGEILISNMCEALKKKKQISLISQTYITSSMVVEVCFISCVKDSSFVIFIRRLLLDIDFFFFNFRPLYFSDYVLSLLAFVCLFLTHRSGIIHKNMHIYFLFILKSLKEKMMKAFKSAGWPTSVALHGEDLVMNLFIFFVFADPVDGSIGMYQLEYTTATSTSTTGSGLFGATSTTAISTTAEPSDCCLKSGVVSIW